MNWRSSLRFSWVLLALLIVSPRVSSAACSSRYVGGCEVDIICEDDPDLYWDYEYLINFHFHYSSVYCRGHNDLQYIIQNTDWMKFKLTYNLRNQEIYYTKLPSIRGISESKIIELNISFSELKNIPVFGKMEIIETLNISNNYLTEAKLYNEHPLNSLRALDYSHNKILNFDKGEDFHPFVGLMHLNMSYNFLESVPAGTFQHLKKLKSLDLSFNNIESLNIMSFEGPTQLQKLYLSSNKIDDCTFLMQKLDYLEELYLDRNQIKYLKTVEFEHLQRLRILILNSNIITNIDNSFFKSMNLLGTLDLKNNKLTKIYKNAFEGSENLNNVDLSYNNIEVLNRNLFKGNNISSFFINGNKIKGSMGKGVFEGISMVSELDLSSQLITGIEDYTFYMLKELISLNISNNQIQNLSKFSFKTLTQLSYLDLSYNRIVEIDFEKQDLLSLKSLNLRNNLIHLLGTGVFVGLSDLQELFLSRNSISSISQNIFQPLQQLVTIELSQNPLEGDLEANSFSGLLSLEYLDLSHTLLNVIKTGALVNMDSLKYLNLSHGNLTELENETFGHNTALEILDLSHNNFNKINISNTLTNLKELYLNNNFITKITKSDFDGPNKIIKLTTSDNLIEEIELHSFDTLSELRSLDLSNNPKFMFKGSLVQRNTKLESLFLSGTGNLIKCTDMESLPLLELVLASSNISDVRSVELFQLKDLISLDLSRNIIKKVEIDVFNNLTNLRLLDLSFNEIISIQPGAFKGNFHLNTLNISHNQMTTITYGTFGGIGHVETIDLSFNNLKTLTSHQFLEILNVKRLIVDSNKLKKIELSTLSDLELLSLGENLLNCEDLSEMLSRSHFRQKTLNITTIKLDFNSANVHGITCYHESGADVTDLSDVSEYNGNSSSAIVALLSEIRNIVNTMKNSHVSSNLNTSDISKNSGILNLLIEKINNLTVVKQNTQQESKKKNDISENTNSTNKLLSRILEILTVTAQSSVKTSADSTKLNDTSSNDKLESFVNKKEFGLKYLFLNNKVVDLEEKIDGIVSRFENKIKIQNETVLKSEKLFVESSKSGTESGHTTFTDVCVVFIFVVLVAILLYKLYEFGIPKLLRRSQRSASTRGITENIENSNF